jgi:hypothetical protein
MAAVREVRTGVWHWKARDGVTRDQILETLRPVLELPVELVLATHCGPSDRAALEHALA